MEATTTINQQPQQYHQCADPESFARGGPPLTTFLFIYLFDMGKEDPNSAKMGHHQLRVV